MRRIRVHQRARRHERPAQEVIGGRCSMRSRPRRAADEAMVRASETPISMAQLSGRIEQAADALRREAADAAEFVRGREESALRLCQRLLAIIRAALDE